MDEIEHKILSFSFNSDSRYLLLFHLSSFIYHLSLSCIIIGTTIGFGIYECAGFQLKYRAGINNLIR